MCEAISGQPSRAERALSFGAIATDYDRLRPRPPAAAVDWLLPDLCQVAVDLAAGTGLLSRALAGRAGRVIAIEPDQRMAGVLRARSPGICVTGGRGESIPLADASVDGVFVSSAWHWMDPERAVPASGGAAGIDATQIEVPMRSWCWRADRAARCAR